MLERLRRIPAALSAAANAMAGMPKARTRSQTGGGGVGMSFDPNELLNAVNAHTTCGSGGVAGGGLVIPRTYLPCPGASLKTWRRMGENPTIALGLAAAKAPAKAAAWTVVSDEAAPAGAEDLISEWVLPLRSAVLRDGLRSVNYGWQPFEIVWELVDGRMVTSWVKPLLPDLTTITLDESGAFNGLVNAGVELGPLDSVVFSLDGEAGDLYGHSRLEQIRERAWWPWEEALLRLQQYLMKAGGIIPRIQFPVGTSEGPDGQQVPNNVIAANMALSLSRGGSVIMPLELASWAEGLIQKGVDPSKLCAWQIDFIEAANLHGAEFTDLLSKFESLMLRGLLVPERSVVEGQNGTKAEAESHGDVGTSVAQDMLDQTLTTVNEGIVDKVLALNFGPGAVGTVRIEAAPLVDEQKALLREITKTVLTAPGNVDLLLGMLDLEAGMEQIGLPMLPDAAPPEPNDPARNADPAQPTNAPPGPGANQQAVMASIFRAAKVFRSKP